MNLFPLIHRSKKAQSFSNPLNGLIFHSDPLHTSPNKEGFETISYNQQPNASKLSNQSGLKVRSNYKLTAERMEGSLQRINLSPIRSSKVIKQTALFDSRAHETLDRTLNASSRLNNFTFPDVEVIPLHLVHNYQDIASFRMTINLEKYFKLYFAQGLRHNSKRLIEKLERYFPLLKEYGMLDQRIDKKKWPKSFWEIKRSDELIAEIEKYEKPSEYWTRYVLTLVHYYCVPHSNVRKSTLQNIIILLKMQIKQSFKNSEGKDEMVLLLDNGKVVEDFMDIPFSTTRLYLTKKMSNHQQTSQAHSSFLNMIKLYEEDCRKKGFVGRLRRHFRKQIVDNKYNEDSINYEVDFSSKEKERKISLHRAMQILQKKKVNQSHKTMMLVATQRTKSQEEIWKEKNIEDSQLREASLVSDFPFHIDLQNKALAKQILSEFQKYHKMSQNQASSLAVNEIYLFTLQTQHPVISALMRDTFHSMKEKRILQTLLGQKLPDDRQLSKTTIPWRCFLELSLLTSRNIAKLIELPDCLQLIRSFVESFMEMNGDEYFRDELTSKLYHVIEGDSQTLSLMEEVLWGWLEQNGFIRHQSIQRELLWRFPQRSKIFYLMLVSMIFGTFQTTPLDLAYEMMI